MHLVRRLLLVALLLTLPASTHAQAVMGLTPSLGVGTTELSPVSTDSAMSMGASTCPSGHFLFQINSSGFQCLGLGATQLGQGGATDGQLLQWRTSGGAWTPFTLGGDSTLSDTGSITNTKLNGTTPGNTCASNTWVNSISSSAVGSCTQPATTNLSDVTQPTAWTPVLKGDGTAGTFTYSVQVGHYTHIGGVVVANFYVGWSAIPGAPTGNLIITGLPVSSVNNASEYQGGYIHNFAGLTLTTSYTIPALQIMPNSATINVVENGSGQTEALLPIAGVATSGQILGTITYFTS